MGSPPGQPQTASGVGGGGSIDLIPIGVAVNGHIELMATEYRAGQTYRIRDTVKDEPGMVSDPTSVQLRIGVVQSVGTVDILQVYTYAAAQLTKESVGIYSRIYTFPQGGTFVFEFTTTGTPETVDVATIEVEQAYQSGW